MENHLNYEEKLRIMVMRYRLLPKLAIAIFISLMWNDNPAIGANIEPFSSGGGAPSSVIIEGPITEGDFERFIKIVKDNQGQLNTVAVFSPGGDFYEAMKIGRAMRLLELGSLVPSRDEKGAPECNFSPAVPGPKNPKNCICASAGFMIHIGSVSRSGLHLVVHRPYFTSEKFGQLPEREARKAFDTLQEKARDYMEEMGVPKRVQEDVLGTASDKGLVLDETTVRTFFVGQLPYYHEWIRNKCSRLSPEESQRLHTYSNTLLRSTRSPRSALSSDEFADLANLQQKKIEEDKCALGVGKERRLAAYEKYFGAKPDDTNKYNFGKWLDATRYLGRPFDELLAEERFVEETTRHMSFLTRAATATTPYISINDSRLSRRNVKAITLLTPPNPSRAFRQRVLDSLQGSWGKPTSVAPNRHVCNAV